MCKALCLDGLSNQTVILPLVCSFWFAWIDSRDVSPFPGSCLNHCRKYRALSVWLQLRSTLSPSLTLRASGLWLTSCLPLTPVQKEKTETGCLAADYSLETNLSLLFRSPQELPETMQVQLPDFLSSLGRNIWELPILCPFPNPSNKQVSCNQRMNRLRNLSIPSVL